MEADTAIILALAAIGIVAWLIDRAADKAQAEFERTRRSYGRA